MIEVPNESSALGLLTEIRQVSVANDDEIVAVNALLADGWKLLHIGQTAQCCVYVLGKPPQPPKRRTGFQS